MARELYESVGFETIPLLTNQKETDLKRWQTRAPDDLWQEVAGAAGRYDNIAIRAGGGTAIIDCDNITTATAVLQHLESIGLGLGKFPLVQSASGDGRHIYIELDNDTYGAYMHLGDDLSGELRFGSGAYCVAPQSTVDGAAYALIAGDWQHRPHVTWSDLSPLLGRAPGQETGVNRLPVPLLRRDIPRVFRIRLEWLKSAGRGASYENYQSRSELEFALLMSLARNGRQFNDAVAVFEKHQPGHYAESRSSFKYLERSWQRAVELIAATQPRPAIAEHYADVQSWSFQYDTDRRIYSAVLSLAYEAATWQPAAAQRDLVRLSGVGCRKTVRRSLERLWSNGLVRRGGRSKLTDATVYEVVGQHATIGHNIPTVDYVLSYGGGLSIEHENRLWSSLGGSTRPVYAALVGGGAMTDREVAEVIEKHVKTARRALNVLQRHGLVEYHIDDRWSAVSSVSLADVADRLGVAADVEERNRHIDRDRKQYKSALDYWSSTSGGVERENGNK